MLNREEVAVLKKAIREITRRKDVKNFWMEDEEGYSYFGVGGFFLRLKTEYIPEDLSIPISLQKEKVLTPVKQITEFVYTEAEDTNLLARSGKDLIKIINRPPDQGFVYVNDKFDFGLKDYLISVEYDNQKNYPITLYEKGNLQIYLLPVRVEEKNEFLK